MNHWELVNKGNIVVSNTPIELWQNACDYFRWCDENPIKIKKTLTSGKGAGQKIETENPRPYTVKGLCIHCGILEEYITDLKNSSDKSSEYYIVASKIFYLIYVQNIELATVGVFNPIFTSKVLNMDDQDIPTGAVVVNIVNGLPTLSNSEADALEKLISEKAISKAG